MIAPLLKEHTRNLRFNFTDKASQLNNAMDQLRSVQQQQGHRGKETADVGPRQQQRHLKDIR